MLPNNQHDWAVWLHANLTNAHHVGGGLWEGTLPPQFDFAAVAAGLEQHDRLKGVLEAATRRIEFYPALADVYETTRDFVTTNARRVPSQFTIQDVGYTSGAATPAPREVGQHAAAVTLWNLLVRMADHEGASGNSLLFIKSHDAKLDLRLEYDSEDLADLSALAQFESEFIATQHHSEQKKSIVRSVLLEMFKGAQRVAFGKLLQRFDEFVDNARSSYAMYMAEFSFEKVRAEVEKDNLDSTLKLNKTFSDIQNQLLALPVAVVIVGGQMNPADGLTLKNVVIWLGAVLFSLLMWMLIANQRSAVASIGDEIGLRWQKIDKQPPEVRARFKPGFDDLQGRRLKQDRLLRILKGVVVVSLVFSTGVLIWFSYEAQLQRAVGCITAWISAWKLRSN